jgi:hypothetical protein
LRLSFDGSIKGRAPKTDKESMVFRSFIAALLVAATWAGAPAHAEKLGDDCGETLLTQWRIQFTKSKITRVARINHRDYMCEPVAPQSANAEVVFLDKDNKPVWTRGILVNRHTNFDTKGKNGKLTGGAIDADEVVIQIKIPRNETTARVQSILVKFKDGTQFGPAGLR